VGGFRYRWEVEVKKWNGPAVKRRRKSTDGEGQMTLEEFDALMPISTDRMRLRIRANEVRAMVKKARRK
jgi:hypothetical protein